jgi:hypothetical protein
MSVDGGRLSVVSSRWTVIGGRLSVVGSQWSVVSSRWSACPGVARRAKLEGRKWECSILDA